MDPNRTDVVLAPTGELVSPERVPSVVGDVDENALAVAMEAAVAMVEGLGSATQRFFRPATLTAFSYAWPRGDSLRLPGFKGEVEAHPITAYVEDEDGTRSSMDVASMIGIVYRFGGIPYAYTREPAPEGFVELQVTYRGNPSAVPGDVPTLVLGIVTRLVQDPSYLEETRWKENLALTAALHRLSLDPDLRWG